MDSRYQVPSGNTLSRCTGGSGLVSGKGQRILDQPWHTARQNPDGLGGVVIRGHPGVTILYTHPHQLAHVHQWYANINQRCLPLSLGVGLLKGGSKILRGLGVQNPHALYITLPEDVHVAYQQQATGVIQADIQFTPLVSPYTIIRQPHQHGFFVGVQHIPVPLHWLWMVRAVLVGAPTTIHTGPDTGPGTSKRVAAKGTQNRGLSSNRERGTGAGSDGNIHGRAHAGTVGVDNH